MTYELLKNNEIRKIKVEMTLSEQGLGLDYCDYCEKHLSEVRRLYWVFGHYYCEKPTDPPYPCGILCGTCLNVFKEEHSAVWIKENKLREENG